MAISPYSAAVADWYLNGRQGPPPLDPTIIAAAAPNPDFRTADAASQLPSSVGAALAGGVPATPAPSASDVSAPLGPFKIAGQIPSGVGTPTAATLPTPGSEDRVTLASGIAPQPQSTNPTAPGYFNPSVPKPTAGAGGAAQTGNEQLSGDASAADVARFYLSATAGGGGGGHVSKTVQQGTPLSPESIKATKEALAAQADVAAKNEQRAADREATNAVNFSLQAALASDEKTRQETIASETRQRQADYRAKYEEAANQDPSDIYHGNIFAGILATIGQAMTQYSAAINKTENTAAKMIGQAIDRNVKIQIEKKQGLYQQFRDAGLDARESENAARAAGLQRAALEAERMAALARSDDAKGRANQTAADLRVKQQGIDNENELKTKDQVTTTTVTPLGGGGSGGGLSPEIISKRRAALVSSRGEDSPEVKAFDKIAYGTQRKSGAEGETVAEAKYKGPARAYLDAANSLLPKMGATVNSQTGEWQLSPQALAGTLAPTSTAKHARASLINILAPDIATIRKGGSAAPAEDEIKAVREEMGTMSPEQLMMTINLASKRAQETANKRIFHGKNQVLTPEEQ